MKRVAWTLLSVLLVVSASSAQTITTDVLGAHNLSQSGTSPVKGTLDPCLFCHAPHSGIARTSAGLWSQQLSTKQDYTLYSNSFSKTMANSAVEPTVGVSSNLCLSCHDGTVAPGQTVPYGTLKMSGTMNSADVFVNSLQGDHPISLKLPLADSPNLVPSLVQSGVTADLSGKVQLIKGNVECTSCHNPHAQYIDLHSQMFLATDGSAGQLCLACHTSGTRTVNSQTNPLANWTTSIHATAGNAVSGTVVGNYPTVASGACSVCHTEHNAGSGAELLRTTSPATASMDTATQTCMNCHNGGSNISPAIANVYTEFAKKGHPFPSGTNTHDAGETAVLTNNRHATCVDCHNAHAAQQVGTTYQAPPAISIAQSGTKGISAGDGVTVVNPAVNQYENCLRCHGSSAGKPNSSAFGYMPSRQHEASGDPFNIIPEMSSSAVSSHPVLHPRSSGLSQPSLLSSLLGLDGKTPVRSMGTQIYCTDCHNSDDNREFGGTGPNGPHGSQYDHILERQYVRNQVGSSGPGTTIQNLNPSPMLTGDSTQPYAMCAKCHDLTVVVSDSGGTFQYHSRHIVTDGVSCSVCHSAHGDAQGGTVRLVNFDLNVVAQYNGQVITYNPSTQTCTLVCHNHSHQGT